MYYVCMYIYIYIYIGVCGLLRRCVKEKWPYMYQLSVTLTLMYLCLGVQIKQHLQFILSCNQNKNLWI